MLMETLVSMQQASIYVNYSSMISTMGTCILHVNNDGKRPRDLSEGFPEGWAATEINGSNAQGIHLLL